MQEIILESYILSISKNSWSKKYLNYTADFKVFNTIVLLFLKRYYKILALRLHLPGNNG